MNKVFYGIGLLVSIFTISFFLLTVDKMTFDENRGSIYDFTLDKSISNDALKKYADGTDALVILPNYKDVAFGEKNIEFTFIHSNSEINLGKQPSVFPKMNIFYKEFKTNEKINIQYFKVQSQDEQDALTIKLLLETNGFKVSMHKTEPLKITLLILFSSLNLSFYLSMTLLLILSIGLYYVYRSKEIGILKLHGWNNRKVTLKLLMRLVRYSYVISFGIIALFALYVAYTDMSKMTVLIKIHVLSWLFFTVVFAFSILIGYIFINFINIIGAVKNNKNNKLIFYVLLLFKLCIVTVLFFTLNKAINSYLEVKSTIQSVVQLEKYNFNRIQTAVVPDEKTLKTLENYIKSLDNNSVFNYSPPETVYDIDRLKHKQATGTLNSSIEGNIAVISNNMLDYIHLVDAKGTRIDLKYLNHKNKALLVPIHYKGNIDEVLYSFTGGDEQAKKEIEVIYIKNAQIHENILFPNTYVYDAIYFVHNVKKQFYINSGEVLLRGDALKLFKNKAKELTIPESSLLLVPLKWDYNLLESNLWAKLYESVFRLFINILSYILCIMSIGSIFLEIRKKELAVYKLMGQYPVKTILKFIGLNILITLCISLVIAPTQVYLIMIEFIIFSILINRYMKNKAIFALKGE